MLYTTVVRRPSVVSGMAFGLLPTLFVWLVLAPLTGKPLFNGFTPQGLLIPLIFNVVIWGCFVGWYRSRTQHPVDMTSAGPTPVRH